jgi:hypothetical protein
MNRFYLLFFSTLFFCLSGISLHAQLNPGDIMFVGFRFDGSDGDIGCEDGIAFAALVDIPANTTIYFTEEEYNGTSFGTAEGTVSWTNTNVTPAGTVVSLTTHVQTTSDYCGGANPSPTASLGTIQFESDVANSWNVSTTAEEVYAYLGAPLMPTTWLCALFTDNLDNSNTPPAALTGFILDFSTVDQDTDLGMFTGSLDCADRDACLASILDLNNWTTENDPGGGDCCDGDGVDYPGDLPDGFFQCEEPVINGVNITNCNGNNLTLEVDGELNGAAQWQWTVTPNGNCETDGASSGATVLFTLPAGDPIGDATFYVRAAGGCLETPVCFAYVVNDLLADLLDISFTAPGPFFSNDGIVPLTGGMPAGGTYSGTGVVDNGDGTYSFDTSTGAGTYSVTYTFTDGNGCTGSAMGDVVVEGCEAPVINGVTLVDCGNGVNGLVTLQVDGELNGAATWEWMGINADCNGTYIAFTTETVTGFYFDFIDQEFVVRANGGCLDAPVCFTFIPSQLTGQPAALSLAVSTYCEDAGVQTGLGGGSPAGGVYSGTGVTDDGNGMTFSFDPAAAGVGSATVTYTYDTGTACGDSDAQATIQVAALPTVSFMAPGPFDVNTGNQVERHHIPHRRYARRWHLQRHRRSG